MPRLWAYTAWMSKNILQDSLVLEGSLVCGGEARARDGRKHVRTRACGPNKLGGGGGSRVAVDRAGQGTGRVEPLAPRRSAPPPCPRRGGPREQKPEAQWPQATTATQRLSRSQAARGAHTWGGVLGEAHYSGPCLLIPTTTLEGAILSPFYTEKTEAQGHPTCRKRSWGGGPSQQSPQPKPLPPRTQVCPKAHACLCPEPPISPFSAAQLLPPLPFCPHGEDACFSCFFLTSPLDTPQ